MCTTNEMELQNHFVVEVEFTKNIFPASCNAPVLTNGQVFLSSNCTNDTTCIYLGH